MQLGRAEPLGQAKRKPNTCFAQLNGKTVLERGLHLERTDDSLVVRSTNRQNWGGMLFGAIAVFMLVAVVHKPPGSQIGLLATALMCLTFLGFGLYFAMLQEVSTIFDWRSRRVVHTLNIAWYQRRRDYSFADVASVGVKEFYGEGGYSYMPVMRLRNGETRSLSAGNYGYPSCAELVDEICAATGLDRRDMLHR